MNNFKWISVPTYKPFSFVKTRLIFSLYLFVLSFITPFPGINIITGCSFCSIDQSNIDKYSFLFVGASITKLGIFLNADIANIPKCVTSFNPATDA